MSRGIKFRFWVESAKRMADWDTAKKECNRLSLLEMDGFIPMQFTGLLDKNGKEVYKGDLLREPEQSDWDKTNFSCFEVFFHDNNCCSYHIGWQMDRMHNHGAVCGGYIPSFKPSVVSKMIIIGNIYENPELVKP